MRAHDVLLYLLTELLQSPVRVEFDFKFNLLGRWILGVLVGVLVRRVHLLQVLILNFDRNKELDALVVLVLVAGDEGRLLARWVEGLLL